MRDIRLSPRLGYEGVMGSELSSKISGVPKLFQIGAKPLDVEHWIDPDERLGAYLDEKARLKAVMPDEVFAAEAETEAAQAEVLGLLVEYLPRRFPAIYRHDGDTMMVAGRSVPLVGPTPLAIAASLVQEDLVLMRKGETGWRIAAASLCFPSAWSLREKFGRPIHEVHDPVPEFGAGTRNAALIERMFDAMRPETPMLRWNWSLHGDGALHQPPIGDRSFGPGAERVFFRLERQTLTKLPASRDILFTIRTYVDPIDAVARQPDGRMIATELVAQIAALNTDQLGYKGFAAERDTLLQRLHAIAKD
jgi:hypothetical protein